MDLRNEGNRTVKDEPCVGQGDMYDGTMETKDEKQVVVGNDWLIFGYKFDRSTTLKLFEFPGPCHFRGC